MLSQSGAVIGSRWQAAKWVGNITCGPSSQPLLNACGAFLFDSALLCLNPLTVRSFILLAHLAESAWACIIRRREESALALTILISTPTKQVC